MPVAIVHLGVSQQIRQIAFTQDQSHGATERKRFMHSLKMNDVVMDHIPRLARPPLNGKNPLREALSRLPIRRLLVNGDVGRRLILQTWVPPRKSRTLPFLIDMTLRNELLLTWSGHSVEFRRRSPRSQRLYDCDLHITQPPILHKSKIGCVRIFYRP
jgi:hypothetical protein